MGRNGGFIMNRRPSAWRIRTKVRKAFSTLFVGVGALIVVSPFIWMFLTSFKTYPETVKIPVTWLPQRLYLGNYEDLLLRMNFLAYYNNTILVTLGITIPQLFVSALAAYAFARLNFPGKNIIFVCLTAAMMIPLQMILLPRYSLLVSFGWLDRFIGVIIPTIPSISSCFFLRQHMLTLPRELDESAILDGCSFFRIFWSIILPLSKSSLVAIGILVFTWSWNDLLWPLIVLTSAGKYVLSLILALIQSRYETFIQYNILLAASVLTTLPILILVIVGQKYFVEGIASTGMKA
jgi:multiple sugar transport system permease protein